MLSQFTAWKQGRRIGHQPIRLRSAIQVTIVSPRTFQRWVQASEGEEEASTEAKTAAQGNSKPQEIHDLVLKVRKETGWGAGRIKGELYRL
jgi:hypothetical protein